MKLNRTLYGLRQSGAVRNEVIHSTLMHLGYHRTSSDVCIYVKTKGAPAYLALYVDHLMFTSPDLGEIKRVKKALHEKFGLKNLGEAEYMLGIQIKREGSGSLLLSQEAYLRRMLRTYGYETSRQPRPRWLPACSCPLRILGRFQQRRRLRVIGNSSARSCTQR